MDPKIRYRRQHFLKARIDPDRPGLLPVRMYQGRAMVLAQLERRRAGEPVRTVPITLSELRRQIDLERGYWDDRRDIPSALVGDETSPMPIAPETQGMLPSEHLPDQGLMPSQTVDQSSTPLAVQRQSSTDAAYQVRGLGQSELERPASVSYPRNPFQKRGMYSSHVTAVERPRLMRTPALLSPVTAVTAMRGMGALDDNTKVAAGFVILGLAVGGGYFAGAAMAPSGRDRAIYGVLGSVLGLFTGPIGLGVLGLVALSRK